LCICEAEEGSGGRPQGPKGLPSEARGVADLLTGRSLAPLCGQRPLSPSSLPAARRAGCSPAPQVRPALALLGGYANRYTRDASRRVRCFLSTRTHRVQILRKIMHFPLVYPPDRVDERVYQRVFPVQAVLSTDAVRVQDAPSPYVALRGSAYSPVSYPCSCFSSRSFRYRKKTFCL
jgi:hypothetical protein